MIKITKLLFSYHIRKDEFIPVLDIPEFHLERGEVLGLAGESGCGKTTLLNLIAGILTGADGEITVKNETTNRFSEAQRDQWRGRNIGYIFQDLNLIDELTAWENILLPCYTHFARNEIAEQTTRAESLVKRLRIENRLQHQPAQLSLGERQRVAIARALVTRPTILLADEPSASLDSGNGTEAIQSLLDICRQEKTTALIVSHDHDVLAQLPQTVEFRTLNRVTKSRRAQ